jgi:acyl-coenzyme A thioesterase 13
MHPCPKIVTEFTKKVLRSFMVESGLEPALFGNRLHIQDATLGQVDFSLLIHNDNLNRLKILHGGTIASLVDLGGSLAVASTGRWATGVSTDINVSYLKSGGREGDTLRCLALCDKIGKSLAYTTVSLRNTSGDLVARGSHTKWVFQCVTAAILIAYFWYL